MSRFQPNLGTLNEKKWEQILEQVKGIDPNSVSNDPASQSELDRLVRITEYLVNVVGSIAPFAEFLNPDINNHVTNFENRLTQVKNSHPNQLPSLLQQLNNDATNIVDRVSPFATSLDSARAAGQAFGRYKKQIEAEKADLQKIHSEADKALALIQNAVGKINDFHRELLEGTDDIPSIHNKVQDASSSIDKMLIETEKFYTKLAEGDTESASIQNQILQAQKDAVKTSSEIADKLSDTNSKLEELERVYTEIVGQAADDGTKEKGLKEQLEDRKTQLKVLVNDFETEFNGLREQIESLLPGATSAGLATAYNDLSEDAKKRARLYSIAFYGGIIALTLSAAATITQSITLWPFQWEFITISNAEDYLNKILFKLPVVIPVLWFTLTVSKRRSELQRLAEEYAHKEALAKSYEGFKKQIVELKRDGDPLLDKLLEIILTAISVNSAKTLEGKHGEKMPMQELIEDVVKKMGDGK